MSIITISRGTKSGGLEIANCLSERLGYKKLGADELIDKSAKRFNVIEEFLLDKLFKKPSLWQKFTDEYERYIIFIQCSLLEAVKEDNIIYHGYAGQFLLRGLPNVLKLRVEAPLEYRIKSVMEEFNYNKEKSVEYIKKMDKQRKHWVKTVYNEDWYNPCIYDMWFNLQNMSQDNICDIVSGAVNHKDFKSTKVSQIQSANMLLECEVKVVLASDNKIWNSHPITVHAHNGVITLRGRTKNKELRNLIMDTASKVKGVKDIRLNITLLSGRFSYTEK